MHPGLILMWMIGMEVTLGIKVLVRYGMNIPDAAKKIQETIKSAVDKTLDVDLKDV